MVKYKKSFIKFALDNGALQFGDFTLKSGKKSPYFFNTGVFTSGKALSKLAKYYVSALEYHAITVDGVFGPAYKGIPLSVAIALKYWTMYRINIFYAYNRKEEKKHGDGGLVMGSFGPDTVIVDDVITSGGSIQESIDIVRKNSSQVSCVLISLDRQERFEKDISPIQSLRDRGVSVYSIVTASDLLDYMRLNIEYHSYVPTMEIYLGSQGSL